MMAKSKARSKGNINVQLKPFPTQAVVVDSNLFILYLVGIFKTIEIDLFEKSKQFGEKQFHLLTKVLGSYKKIIITQPVLTETTNHLDKLNRKYDTLFYRTILYSLLKFEDSPTKTIDILNGTAFCTLGFADSSLEILSSQYVVLTDDDDLYGHIISKKGKAIFWRHLDPKDF